MHVSDVLVSFSCYDFAEVEGACAHERFSFFQLLLAGSIAIVVFVLSFSFFQLLRYSPSPLESPHRVLVSFSCYIKLGTKKCLTFRYVLVSFSCYFTQFDEIIFPIGFSFFQLLPQERSHSQLNERSFSFFQLLRLRLRLRTA